ncbi:MAG TPA: RTX toxin [Patescibacteria group bacterium]|nr:RTX toxin [Patescibacteria group bacterium]
MAVFNGTTGNDTLTGSGVADTLNGLAGNDSLNGGLGADTIVGGTGDDTYVVDNTGDVATEAVAAGTDLVQSGISYTLGANVENLTLTGTGAIKGTGNDLDNVLTGNAGANLLNGGLGADTMIGGAGNDTYVVDDAGDVVTELASAETDLVQSGIDYTLGDNVENLTLTGTENVNGTGNALTNVLTGNAGANLLDGGLGADKMTGGAGDDIYVVDNVGDVVTEAAAAGTDLVQAGISYVLGANVENLTLTGTGDINGTGNTLANVLTGNAGANLLNGGLGADTMTGGAGDDTYVVDNAGDVVAELTGEGTDQVQAGVSYTLGGNVENLTLTGTGGVNATGNGLDNVLTGNTGANLLNGGLGADTMVGAAGNDTYSVDDTGDVITELAAGGTDQVQAGVSYMLTDNVENLTLTGTGDINGTGNALVNILTGNTGANLLDGGLGADKMIGGVGSDTYVVDNIGDVVTELVGEGTDLVQAGVSYTLGANVENLTLTGTGNINGTGNALANEVTGNAGANVLNGGLGADVMAGGAGDDTYVVDDAGDAVTEAAAAGTDLVQSGISYVLGANLENLTLTGTGAINGTGNVLVNVLMGNAGANLLAGGLGADTMAGGAGNDTYVVDDAGDVITEAASAGTDLVQAGVSHVLEANVDNLTLAGTGNINGTGNALANVLTGNTGANLLDGGLGADRMTGGAGNDTYAVDNIGDVVTELVGEGTDLVQAGISYTLGAEVENLTLTGTGNINGAGNALNNVLTGNTGANLLNGGLGADTMAGGTGNDTYVVDDAGDVVTELTGEGTDLVQSGISYTLGSDLENLTLTGTGNINGTGNALNNVLTGNTGANLLNGGLGADTMAGGIGNDTYVVDDAGDVIAELAAGGTDRVQSGASYTLGLNLENLTLTGTGNINGTGNALNNVLTGNAGANLLNGGLGADTMSGGAGDDIYVVDNAGDAVTELTGEGTDLVQSGVSHTLGANVENLTLTGMGAINGVGNALDNVLTGNAGANLLDGGLGADTMAGSAGNDTYVVDDVGDVVNELASSGTDLVQAGISYTLGLNLENVTLTGTGNINATGNELVNLLTGNAGGNLLDGGLGADKMIGGAGDDTYVVDDIGDVVTEAASAGTDLVQAGISYTLGLNLENLTLTGTGAINGTGNALANVLTGNAGANLLNGGLGADTMVGGAGDDTYVVDNAGDVINELAAGGSDLVQSSASYVLGLNLENLTLTGTGAISGTGNALANVLTGNTGANLLDGGLGADTMAGGGGNDTYVVDDAGDVVTDTGGIDLVQAGISYTLTDNVENLMLTGTGNISGTGNSLANVLTGNVGANLLDGGLGADKMTGGAGDDTYVVDAAGDVVTELTGEGTDLVKAGISYTLGANVENLTLTGTGSINGTGNALANVLTGNAGANLMNGGLGADTMTGGAGNDTYIVDDAGDVVTELTGEGTDLVQAGASYTLGANVENLTLTGTGAINGTGNVLANVLTGNAGANLLDGGLGADTMAGGAGNDTYVVDDTGDVITEAASAGTDQVQSGASYTLGLNLENLTLTGTGNINGTGNALANVLTGNAGANLLDGGLGIDTMAGGAGDDTYVLDNAGDVVTEAASAGTDQVQAGVSYTLGANVENLTLTGTGNINGTGNALANVLTGNAGANLLDGGLGADTMAGGAGNDTYVVNDLGDVVTELSASGTDLIQMAATFSATATAYTLGDNVENLVMLGTGNLGATGNALANVLTGNAGANLLDGGLGADTMIGGAGNDTYVVDNAGDVVTEAASAGTDKVMAGISYTLSANLENIDLTGSGDINGTGNGVNNVLNGNSGNNILDGGAGLDTMAGGAGNDTYVVDNAGDSIVELAAAGTDNVNSSVNYTLGANLENLTLTGSTATLATGNALDNTILGNSLANVLKGGDGNDSLNGGAGADTLWGEAGLDTLTGGLGADLFEFAGTFGHDWITNDGAGSYGDQVQFDGLASTDVSIAQSGNDLQLTTSGGNIVTLTDWYTASGDNKVKAFNFTDGAKKVNATSWDAASSFNIVFDYTYASSAFFTDAVKADLDFAASLWERAILDEFPDVTAGTSLSFRNPSTLSTNVSTTASGVIDDLLIYVGTTDLESYGAVGLGGPSATYALGSSLDTRWNSTTTFQPWVGSISFDATPHYSNGPAVSWFFDTTPETMSDVATAGASKLDFISTATHEIGHVLGILNGINAWNAHYSSTTKTFTGANAEAHNGGNPIPLVPTSPSHPNGSASLAPGSTTAFANNQEPVMSYGISTTGHRLVPTDLELGILQDIGYNVSYSSKYTG